MIKFFVPDIRDKRIPFAKDYLVNSGLYYTDSFDECDFTLLGVNSKDYMKYNKKPVFAGNVSDYNVFDYLEAETFALENAYLTAEGAVSLAIRESDFSIINSRILILGYGRIGKALHKYLSAFSPNIVVCARSLEQRVKVELLGAKAIDFDALSENLNFDYIFNTVPHPVLNEKELKGISKNSLIMDLASFPGGVDVHFADLLGLNLIVASSLPSKFSPKSAGIAVGKAVLSLLPKEGIV